MLFLRTFETRGRQFGVLVMRFHQVTTSPGSSHYSAILKVTRWITPTPLLQTRKCVHSHVTTFPQQNHRAWLSKERTNSGWKDLCYCGPCRSYRSSGYESVSQPASGQTKEDQCGLTTGNATLGRAEDLAWPHPAAWTSDTAKSGHI